MKYIAKVFALSFLTLGSAWAGECQQFSGTWEGSTGGGRIQYRLYVSDIAADCQKAKFLLKGTLDGELLSPQLLDFAVTDHWVFVERRPKSNGDAYLIFKKDVFLKDSFERNLKFVWEKLGEIAYLAVDQWRLDGGYLVKDEYNIDSKSGEKNLHRRTWFSRTQDL